MKRLVKILAVFALGIVVLGAIRSVVTTKAASSGYFYGFNTPFLPFDVPGNISAETQYLASACNSAAQNFVLRIFFPSAGIDDLKKLFSSAQGGAKYIVTLSNYWGAGAQGPGCDPKPPYDRCNVPPTQWYSQTYKDGFRQYVDAVTKQFAGNPNILMWEIMNEPSCDSNPACPAARRGFLADIAQLIASNDPGKLISPGLQGNTDPQEYLAITNLPGISANSCHMYPSQASANDPEVQRCLNLLDLIKAARPDIKFYVGEAGFDVPNNGCTPQGVTSQTSKRAVDLKKLEAIFTTGRPVGKPQADGFLVWRFDPPQSNIQHCDNSSVFPGDPVCGGAGGFNYQNPPGGPGGPQTVHPGGGKGEIVYPPLGSLQECPPEFPTVGEVSQQVTVPAQTPTGDLSYYCNIQPGKEPDACKKLLNPDPNAPIPDLINRDTRWSCFPSTCGAWAKIHTRPDQQIPNCGRFKRYFCADTAPGTQNDLTWLGRLRAYKDYGASHGLGQCQPDWFPEQDRNTIADCLASHIAADPNFLSKTSIAVTETGNPSLPVCVPNAANPNNRCTSTCGTPVEINQLLQMQISGSCASGNCAANIKIDPNTPLFIPLAKDLANYFAGTLDSGSVAEGLLTQQQLDDYKKAIATNNPTDKKTYDLITQAFSRVGVAKKLLPPEVQDQLKCQFIKTTAQKVNAKLAWLKNSTGPEPSNTKYLFYTDDSHKTTDVFKIDGIKVTDFRVPPYFDAGNADLETGCQRQQYTINQYNDWYTDYGSAWVDVPLYDNEEAQGKIEFASGGVYTPKLSPIQTSIPEIHRLFLVTQSLQDALIPKNLVAAQVNISPSTIGPEIKPQVAADSACTRTPKLSDIYGSENDYNQAVLCQQPDTPYIPSDSKVCEVGPDGQFNCFQQVPSSEVPRSGIKEFDNVVLQTRNVTPYLYDTYLQAIASSSGFLRIFRPEDFESLAGQRKQSRFEQAYLPLPAESNRIQFKLQSIQGGVALADTDQKKTGWMLLFDKLGGVFNARNFVLNLLYPSQNQIGGSQTPTP